MEFSRSLAAVAAICMLAAPAAAMNLRLGSEDASTDPEPVAPEAPSAVASEVVREKRGAAGGPSMLGSPVIFTDAPVLLDVPPPPPVFIKSPVQPTSFPPVPQPRVIPVAAEVPLPSALFLLGGALAGFSLFRRRF